MDGTQAFGQPGDWLKGALHIHTTCSDGKATPDAAAAFYRSRGFDFIVLTDHRRIASLSGAPPAGLTVIPGAEWDANSRKQAKWWHFVTLLPDASDAPHSFRPEPVYDWARQHSPFVILAHPYWSNLSGDDLCAFSDVDAVEVFNYGCELELLRGHAEYPWDYALGQGAHLKAIAADDCHWKADDAGYAWVMVRASKNEPTAIIEALKKGLFYSSTGAEIRTFRRDGEKVSVRCSPASVVRFSCRSYTGGYVRAKQGKLLEHAVHALEGGETYLRVEVIGPHGERAWSNPVFLPRR